MKRKIMCVDCDIIHHISKLQNMVNQIKLIVDARRGNLIPISVSFRSVIVNYSYYHNNFKANIDLIY